MKAYLGRLGSSVPAMLVAAIGLALSAGCASHTFAPKQSGFLSNYARLKKVDDTTWRYVETNRVALYNKFHLSATKCLVPSWDGKPVSPETQQKVADYLRESITKALSDAYPIVNNGGSDVGELRVAITD